MEQSAKYPVNLQEIQTLIRIFIRQSYSENKTLKINFLQLIGVNLR